MSGNESPQYQTYAPQHPGLIKVPAAVFVSNSGDLIPINKQVVDAKGKLVSQAISDSGIVAVHKPQIFVPMVFRLEIPNSPFSASPLMLYVTPGQIQITGKKSISEHVIRRGTIREEWGDELDTWSCSGQIAAFYSPEFGLTQVRRGETQSYKNFLSLLTFFKNNGRSYYTRGRSVDPFTREDREKLEETAVQEAKSYRNRGDLSRRRPSLMSAIRYLDQASLRRTQQKSEGLRQRGLDNSPTRLIRHVGFVEIMYDMRILEGHFDSLEWDDNVEHPHNINYSFTFTVKRQFDIAARMTGFGTPRG